MIVGVGVDIAELDRIAKSYARFGAKFSAKILNQSELDRVPANVIPFLASRFAAKEAAVKALGTGFRDGIQFHDLRIEHEEAGRPYLVFGGRFLEEMQRSGLTAASLSISHCGTHAVAAVVLG